MLKTIMLCASLVLPTVAFAAVAPAPTTQSMASASKGGVKSLKGTRSRSKARRQGRSNKVASSTAKRSARRGRGTRSKTAK